MSIWTILFVVLLIAWIGGFTVFHVASGLIHLLLVLAVISLILHFVLGQYPVPDTFVKLDMAHIEPAMHSSPPMISGRAPNFGIARGISAIANIVPKPRGAISIPAVSTG